MSALRLRLLPDETPEREAIALEHFALSRRLSCLIEHSDCLEAQGDDATHIKAEIARTLRALGATHSLLSATKGAGP